MAASLATVPTWPGSCRLFRAGATSAGPLILACAGLVFLVGPALEPARQIRDWLSGGLWQVLFALAVAALVIALVDDRCVRRRHRAQAVAGEQIEQIEPAAGLVLEKRIAGGNVAVEVVGDTELTLRGRSAAACIGRGRG